MNPLNWSGPEFLGMFFPLLVLSLLVAAVLRWWLRQPGPSSDMSLPRVQPYEAALLRGRSALVESALASLAHQGLIRMDGNQLVVSGSVPFDAPLIERIVHASVNAGEVSSSALLAKAEPAIEQLRAPLERRGWLLGDPERQLVRWLPALPPLGLLLLGLSKLVVGLTRDRPVFYLVVLCFMMLPALALVTRAPWRSRRGDKVLQALREEQEPLKQTARSATSASALSRQDTAMAVGLFGLAAVGYTEFELMRRHLEASGYSSSGSSFDGGGGDSGGGDGGGGDGGGGGCGGCGGGCS